jgi:hypothetical protein
MKCSLLDCNYTVATARTLLESADYSAQALPLYACCCIYQFLSTCTKPKILIAMGRAIAQAVNRRLPTAAARVRAQVMSDLRWRKWRCGRFSPSTSVSPANSHSTNCAAFIIIYHLGLVQ